MLTMKIIIFIFKLTSQTQTSFTNPGYASGGWEVTLIKHKINA